MLRLRNTRRRKK